MKRRGAVSSRGGSLPTGRQALRRKRATSYLPASGGDRLDDNGNKLKLKFCSLKEDLPLMKIRVSNF